MYYGKQNKGNVIVKNKNNIELDLRLGSDPAQLALAILADYLRSNKLAYKLHQDFKFDIIANIYTDKTEWEITRKEIDNWLSIRKSITLSEVRKKFSGLLCVSKGTVGAHPNYLEYGPRILLCTSSKSACIPQTDYSYESSEEEGTAFIDISFTPEEAKKLYEHLGPAINGEIKSSKIEFEHSIENSMPDVSLSDVRNIFGTFISDKLEGVRVSDDYYAKGPRVIITAQCEGRRGPRGKANIDVAYTLEMAENLHIKLGSVIDQMRIENERLGR